MAEKSVVTDADVRATLAEIEASRRNLASAITMLRERELFNPLGVMVQRHPVQSALGAATAGFMLAQGTGGSKVGSTLLGRMIHSGVNTALPMLLKMLF